MRKQKVIKIDEREITVKELRVKDILEIMEPEATRGDLLLAVSHFLPKCADIEMQDLIKLSPSEIRVIYEAFREVNADFFELARGLGLGHMVEKIKQAAIQDFSELLAGSLRQGISVH